MNYNELASKESLNKTKKALEEKGYDVFSFENRIQVLEKIKTLIPPNASVMNGASITLEKIGYTDLLKSGKNGWDDLHAKVDAESDPTKRAEIRKAGVSSDFYLGSVHALTEDGQMIIASNTGSQLPHVVFTSPNLIFVIGTQKIVPDLNEAMKRLEDYILPLEDKRMKQAYGMGTTINKVVIFKGEHPIMGRKINVILVNEKLGF